MDSRQSANFCSDCGAELASGDAFCSECGSAVRGRAASARTDFRRRVEDLTVEGWDVKHDYGDRVVMVNRGFGSLGIHALLLVFTGGLGNLLYAWYRYSPGAERIELRADGTEKYVRGGPSSDRVRARNVVFSVFSALIAYAILSDGPSLVGWLFGLAFLVAALVVLAPVRRRLHERKSITTFGRARGTDEEVVTAPDTPCVGCSRPVNTGVKRTFHERRYLAGVPIHILEEGENHYCRSCANGDPFARTGVTRREVSVVTDED
jgi:predicted RNA-binding Zn-ribbon protein involved in translation (DUF1610 family)